MAASSSSSMGDDSRRGYKRYRTPTSGTYGTKRARGPRGFVRKNANVRTGGFLGIETKFLDASIASTVMSTQWVGGELDPAANSLGAIAQGDGESDRDGRKCTITSIHVRGHIELTLAAGTGAGQPEVATLYLVQDTQTNGAQLNAEDVISNAASAVGGIEVLPHAFQNLQYSKRFRVLKKFTCAPSPVAGAGDGTANDFAGGKYPFEWNVKCNIPVIHTGTTTAITAIADNSIHIIGCASNTTCKAAYVSRVRFVG